MKWSKNKVNDMIKKLSGVESYSSLVELTIGDYRKNDETLA